jgi:UDP-N-acetylmuramate dehydrogenase
MMRDELYSRFVDEYDGPVKKNEPLSAYTTFRTGGAADLFVDVIDTGQLVVALQLARQIGIPFFVIGEGSNLLVSDNGYRGLIIRNSVRGLEVKGNEIVTGAGELLDEVVDVATKSSLTGLEFAAGIWGTIGGAVYGNAGAFGSNIGAVLKNAELVDREGNVRIEGNQYFQFTYRHSILKETKEIVTHACFNLEEGDKEAIRKRTDEIHQLRARKHPTTPCSAGCFFKNVEDASQPNGKMAAGRLLEEVGAKDMRVGGAAVFGEHANIIVNTGQATSKDIRRLADILKERVKDKFGILLNEEIICLGDF